MTTNLPAIQMPNSGGLLVNRERFDFGWDVARLFAASTIVPKEFAGKPENCFIAIHMAERLNEDALVVMQHLNNISGKWGWSAQYMISRANLSGTFSDKIKWRVSGKGSDNLSVIAYATSADSGEVVESPDVDMKMAKGEGWTKNTKYQSMPEVMLRYRAATFLIRMNCPEVMLGVKNTADEIEDMRYAGTLQDSGDGTFAVALDADAFERAAAGAPQVTQAPVQQQPATRRGRPTNAEKAAREAEAQQPAATEPTPETAAPAATASIDVTDSDGQVTAYGTETLAINELRRLFNAAEDEATVIAVRNANGPFLGEHADLAQTAQNRLNAFAAARVAAEKPAEEVLAGLDAAEPTVPQIQVTLMLADGETSRTFNLPGQAEGYLTEFRAVFTAIAERRIIPDYNKAVQAHATEVNKLKESQPGLVQQLRTILTEVGKIATTPRPATGASEVH